MCSGRKTLGKRTTLGSGKIGKSSDIAAARIAEVRLQTADSMVQSFCTLKSAISVNGLGFLVHVVHQHVLTQSVRRREIRLPFADLGDPPHETDQVVIACEHERVDHDAAL